MVDQILEFLIELLGWTSSVISLAARTCLRWVARFLLAIVITLSLYVMGWVAGFEKLVAISTFLLIGEIALGMVVLMFAKNLVKRSAALSAVAQDAWSDTLSIGLWVVNLLVMLIVLHPWDSPGGLGLLLLLVLFFGLYDAKHGLRWTPGLMLFRNSLVFVGLIACLLVPALQEVIGSGLGSFDSTVREKTLWPKMVAYSPQLVMFDMSNGQARYWYCECDWDNVFDKKGFYPNSGMPLRPITDAAKRQFDQHWQQKERARQQAEAEQRQISEQQKQAEEAAELARAEQAVAASRQEIAATDNTSTTLPATVATSLETPNPSGDLPTAARDVSTEIAAAIKTVDHDTISAKSEKPTPPRRNLLTGLTLPAGETLTVVLQQSLGSDYNQVEEPFRARLDGATPLRFDQRELHMPGFPAEGYVVESKRAGRIKGRAKLVLALSKVYALGTWHKLETDNVTFEADSSIGRDLAQIGSGGGIGAMLGGGKGAAIGSSAGLISVLLVRGQAVNLPAGLKITFQLSKSSVF